MVLGSVVITAIRMFNYIIHQRITNGRVTEDSVAVLKKKKKPDKTNKKSCSHAQTSTQCTHTNMFCTSHRKHERN